MIAVGHIFVKTAVIPIKAEAVVCSYNIMGEGAAEERVLSYIPSRMLGTLLGYLILHLLLCVISRGLGQVEANHCPAIVYEVYQLYHTVI